MRWGKTRSLDQSSIARVWAALTQSFKAQALLVFSNQDCLSPSSKPSSITNRPSSMSSLRKPSQLRESQTLLRGVMPTNSDSNQIILLLMKQLWIWLMLRFKRLSWSVIKWKESKLVKRPIWALRERFRPRSPANLAFVRVTTCPLIGHCCRILARQEELTDLEKANLTCLKKSYGVRARNKSERHSSVLFEP